ncbi:hypothetical protein C8R44DRAFT_867021 [Mycena epipterygia]|nr:hypothetical protein C8R44DRAFT_867021 [Mycena epipterygia]
MLSGWHPALRHVNRLISSPTGACSVPTLTRNRRALSSRESDSETKSLPKVVEIRSLSPQDPIVTFQQSYATDQKRALPAAPSDESRDSFDFKALTAQIESQHPFLANVVKGFKRERPLLPSSKAPITPPLERKLPLPKPADECILLRFNGPVPPIYSLTYPQILEQLNATLASLGLPTVLSTEKTPQRSILVFPRTKDDLRVLADSWETWTPLVFPGGRNVQLTPTPFLRVDGVPFATAESLWETGREFMKLNPQYGPIVGLPTWMNKPPNAAKVAAMDASTLPTTNSLFIRLQSGQMVEQAVADGRVALADSTFAVQRGFPQLRVIQCLRCFQYGHYQKQCNARARCGRCGKAAHGVCSDPPICIHCSASHRSDSKRCPYREQIVGQLREQIFHTNRMLDAQSRDRLSSSQSAEASDT